MEKIIKIKKIEGKDNEKIKFQIEGGKIISKEELKQIARKYGETLKIENDVWEFSVGDDNILKKEKKAKIIEIPQWLKDKKQIETNEGWIEAETDKAILFGWQEIGYFGEEIQYKDWLPKSIVKFEVI